MSPLETVASKLTNGNEAELARLLELSRSTVNCWKNATRRGKYLAGSIPAKYHPQIFEIAKARGVKILPSDLIIT